MHKYIVVKDLKTREEILDLIKDKKVVDVKYEEGYASITFIFEDGTDIDIIAEDSLDFRISTIGVKNVSNNSTN